MVVVFVVGDPLVFEVDFVLVVRVGSSQSAIRIAIVAVC